MKLLAQHKEIAAKNNDTIILFMSEAGARKGAEAIPGTLKYIRERMDLSFFKGKQGEVFFIPFAGSPNILLCGTGKDEQSDNESLRRCAAAAAGVCREKSITNVHVVVPAPDSAETLACIAEGMFLANYSFDKYKTKKSENGKPLIQSALFHTGTRNAQSILHRVATISRNTLLCRDLVNDTSEVSDPAGIARLARAMAKVPGVTCTVLGRKEIVKLKMGLLLAVNRGSSRPPHLVVLKYAGNRGSKKSIALIGKGITFDSGGMNLKPSGHIEDMRSDMAGAAAVLYAFRSIAELKLRKNVFAVLPLTENMLARDSYRPGDVFTAFNGTTVQIGNTDAEGRLVLADALSYAEKSLKPECIIDIATLTGACVATFGEILAAYITEDDRLARLVENAGMTTGERLWRLPLHKDYEEALKSDIADIGNMSSERNAGTIIGATFLKNFVSKARWAHIDIASTAFNTKPRGYRPRNATGFGVRLLVEAVTSWKD